MHVELPWRELRGSRCNEPTYRRAHPRSLWTARYVPGHGFIDHERIDATYYLQEWLDAAVDETGRGIVVWRHRDSNAQMPPNRLRACWFE